MKIPGTISYLGLLCCSVLFLAHCGGGTSDSNKSSSTTDPEKQSSTTTKGGPTTTLRVALVYDQSKEQIVMTGDAWKFPMHEKSYSDEEFKKYVEELLKQDVVPTGAVPAPTDFSITPLRKIEVSGFGIVYIFHWSSFNMVRGNNYKNASPLMVFDDGGQMAVGDLQGTSEEGKRSALAIRYFLLSPAVVTDLHQQGFKIPGEGSLYDHLRAINPKIDTSKYPNI